MGQNELENLRNRAPHCEEPHQANLSANCWAEMANDHQKGRNVQRTADRVQQVSEHHFGLGSLLHSAGNKLSELAHSQVVHNATSKLGQLAHGETAHKAEQQFRELSHSRIAHEAENSAKAMIPGGNLLSNPQRGIEQLKQGHVPGGVEGIAGLALHASPLGMLGTFGAGIARQEIQHAQAQKRYEQHHQYQRENQQHEHRENRPEHGAKM